MFFVVVVVFVGGVGAFVCIRLWLFLQLYIVTSGAVVADEQDPQSWSVGEAFGVRGKTNYLHWPFNTRQYTLQYTVYIVVQKYT